MPNRHRVNLRTALGKALFRLPAGVRRQVPRSFRQGLRLRFGPFAPWEAGFGHAPPPPAPGEVSGPPDFVGIGSQRAGTTWWFGLIVDHPDVFHRSSIHKELHYFSRYATDAFGPQEILRYHLWFPRPAGKKSGEWTPDYLSQRWVPPLLMACAPDARLLVIVRDPVERFLSGVAHSEMRPGSHRGIVVTDAIERGFYASALRHWESQLESGQLLVLQYERCVADPAGELARTYRFLELDDKYLPGDLRVPRSPTVGARPELTSDARRRLIDLYSADVTQLKEMVPDLDISLWPDFA
jgi:Sulfotransferase family